MNPIPVLILTSLLASGCANLPMPDAEPRQTPLAAGDGRADFALTVASAGASLNTVIDRALWRGTYGGRNTRGCTRVRLNMADHPKHDWHYLVCGNDVTEIRDVAPTPPRDYRLIAVLDGLTQAAWKTRRVQRMPYEAFELEAELAGLDGIGGCWHIDQRLLYRDMVVDVRETAVC